ncbi:MAG: sulfite exporter TauE/SafE family protein [Chloroflexi bacterium]|nr:sulfite exporter TauE/SafE family protein [Chloroflexota bacterium]
MENLSLFVIFFAGVLSFLSPCILAVIPVYVADLTGSVGSARGTAYSRAALLKTFAFIAGFSMVFILLGAMAGAVGSLAVRYQWLWQKVAGAVLVGLGLHVLGVLQIPFLNYQRRLVEPHPGGQAGTAPSQGGQAGTPPSQGGQAGTPPSQGGQAGAPPSQGGQAGAPPSQGGQAGAPPSQGGQAGTPVLPGVMRSFVMGAAFSSGWTPCIGPILSAILAMAIGSQTAPQGAFLMAVFSLGMAVPFIALALALGRVTGWLQKMRRFVRIVSVVSGLLVIAIGLIIFFDASFTINAFILRYLPWLKGGI